MPMTGTKPKESLYYLLKLAVNFLEHFYRRLGVILWVYVLVLFQACTGEAEIQIIKKTFGGFSTPPINPTTDSTVPASLSWTWKTGSNRIFQPGIYGTKGQPAMRNVPGTRNSVASWIDKDDNLWIFGGIGLDSQGTLLLLNDLWRFDGQYWTWVSGSDLADRPGIYGIKGESDLNNMPGARFNPISWLDRAGNLWLFGGFGDDINGAWGSLNDLWKFDGTAWTWVGGSSAAFHLGNYGVKGRADSDNIPRSRSLAAARADANGNVWLFGGSSVSATGAGTGLNDLWKFDGTAWTWIAGSNLGGQPGSYGVKGVSNENNVPGARIGSQVWIDSAGNLFLFGGSTYDPDPVATARNDLWKFDGTNWVWIDGSDTINQPGIYGIRGETDATSIPGARRSPAAWVDKDGNFWIFGGFGVDSKKRSPLDGVFSELNDLWRFDGNHWTWMAGSNLRNQLGKYGTTGISDAANIAGARTGGAGLTDHRGDLWLFGGSGRGSADGLGLLNDLWKIKISLP